MMLRGSLHGPAIYLDGMAGELPTVVRAGASASATTRRD